MGSVRSTTTSYFSGLAATGLVLLLSSAKPVDTPLAKPSLNVSETTSDLLFSSTARSKTEGRQGVFVEPATDCDGDGLNNDSKIDFDGDGIADECVLDAREDIPEPPFQQSFTPSPEQFNSLIPDVGWNAQYQCGDGLEVVLSRPSENELQYRADGITLSSPVVYDDIDPNLNQPLVVQDPMSGLRYSFRQERDGEFYEYAIADYNGNVGLYVYQTGAQVIAAPCQVAASN
ncbi:MAG: hypothetical protein AAF703_08795 [Cyanobacteria bacterium P01_D01_bin.105]